MTPQQIAELKRIDQEVLDKSKRRKVQDAIDRRRYDNQELGIENKELDKNQLIDVKTHER